MKKIANQSIVQEDKLQLTQKSNVGCAKKRKMKEKNANKMLHTLPLITTGRSNIPCMPRMADCGGLIIGVPNNEPNTPPLL